MRLAKETPHELPPHGFQSLFLTLALLFTSRRICSLTVIYSFFSHQPRYTAAIASWDWHAAYSTCAEGKDGGGGRADVKMEMYHRRR